MHHFVRILYDSDSFHPKRQQGGGESGTSRYVVIRHDTMGKTEAEVSRWLGGTHNFTLRTIAKISDALGVKLLSI